MTAGQLEIMDAYDTYEMNVYTSCRSCAFPEAVYAANRQNAVNASLVAGGNGIDGALLGTPCLVRHFLFLLKVWKWSGTTICAIADIHDARDELWRIQEAHIIQYYDVPTCFNGSEMVYDLNIGRYTIQGLKNQEPMINFFADELDESQFTLAGVRASASR